MPGFAKVNGTFQSVASAHAKVNGTWQEVSEGYTKVDGSWVAWFSGGGFPFFVGYTSDIFHFGVSDDEDGYFYFVAQNTSKNYYDVYALNPDLSLAWVRNYNKSASNEMQGRKDRLLNRHPSNKGVAFSGTTHTSGFDEQQLIMEFDQAGNNNGLLVGNTGESIQRVMGNASNSTYNAIVGTVSIRAQFYLTSNFDSLYRSYAYTIPSFSDTWHDDVSVDSSGNFYTAGRSRLTSAYFQHTFKYTSSGNLVYAKRLSNDNTLGDAVAVAPDGTNYHQLDDLRIIVTNSSGTITGIWDPNLASNNFRRMACDSEGNVYFFADRYNGSFTETILVKLNSSGTILWQRAFQFNSVNAGVNALRIGYDDNILFGIEGFFGRYPSDGSITGTFSVGGQSVTIANSSAVSMSISNYWAWDNIGGTHSTFTLPLNSDSFTTTSKSVSTTAIS